VLLIAAEMLRERIPGIVRASQEEIARQLSKPSAAESEECPLGGSLSSSLIARTFSPVDNQSGLLLLENQTRRPTESTHSPNRGASNSNLDGGLDFLNDVDWECWDESFINFDWWNRD
jgi:hypothetical protein